MVGGKLAELGTLVPLHNRVCWHGKQVVVHWGLYPSDKVREPWVIVPDVMSITGCVRTPLLIKEKFHLWDYSQEIWWKMNPGQLVGIWKEIRAQSTRRIL